MIRLYTSLNFFKPDEILLDNEAFFKNNIGASDISDKGLKAMKLLDGAILLDKNTGKIQTPFGICSIYDLSTGCKTLLNVIYLIEYNKYPQVKAINCTECGWNALEQIFELLDETNAFGIIIEHDNELYNCSDRDYLVNDKEHITSMFDFN